MWFASDFLVYCVLQCAISLHNAGAKPTKKKERKWTRTQTVHCEERTIGAEEFEKQLASAIIDGVRIVNYDRKNARKLIMATFSVFRIEFWTNEYGTLALRMETKISKENCDNVILWQCWISTRLAQWIEWNFIKENYKGKKNEISFGLYALTLSENEKKESKWIRWCLFGSRTDTIFGEYRLFIGYLNRIKMPSTIRGKFFADSFFFITDE